LNNPSARAGNFSLRLNAVSIRNSADLCHPADSSNTINVPFDHLQRNEYAGNIINARSVILSAERLCTSSPGILRFTDDRL